MTTTMERFAAMSDMVRSYYQYDSRRSIEKFFVEFIDGTLIEVLVYDDDTDERRSMGTLIRLACECYMEDTL